MQTEWTDELRKALRRPFPATAIKWKAQATSKDKTRALAVAFIDARNVMERLDAEVGPGAWEDDYMILVATQNEYIVQCSLTILGVTKRDVGDSSAAMAGGSNLAKTAYSDALKRAAIKFGVGRYLYALPKVWVEYDEQRKRLTEIPELPKWAQPPHIGEETTDPGEELPDPEPEPIVEPTKKPTATKVGRDVSELIGTKGKKQKSNTSQELLDEIWARFVALGADKVDTINKSLEGQGYPAIDQLSEQQAGEVIKRLRAKHWKHDKKSLARFWAEATEMGYTETTAHDALKCKSLEDYTGDIESAIKMLKTAV